uniref:Uncharacterized protein n=1 Tax=Arundo donax TaxID=35708 RepID=A0A0A9D699_ARUDO
MDAPGELQCVGRLEVAAPPPARYLRVAPSPSPPTPLSPSPLSSLPRPRLELQGIKCCRWRLISTRSP